MAGIESLEERRRLFVFRAVAARERARGDRLALRSWHAVNRARRALARAYWARAAASVLADDVEIARLEEQLRLVA